MVNLAFLSTGIRQLVPRKAAAMENSTLLLLIRDKLADRRRLQQRAVLCVWTGLGHGEICAACKEMIAKGQIEIEGSREGRNVFFHVRCFQVWESKRREYQTTLYQTTLKGEPVAPGWPPPTT